MTRSEKEGEIKLTCSQLMLDELMHFQNKTSEEDLEIGNVQQEFLTSVQSDPILRNIITAIFLLRDQKYRFKYDDLKQFPLGEILGEFLSKWSINYGDDACSLSKQTDIVINSLYEILCRPYIIGSEK